MLQDVISECSGNFGPPPRRFSLWDRLTYLRVTPPEWLRYPPYDGLTILFTNLGELWRDGKVVWGHFIQANALLYSPGHDHAPAEVVYSLEQSGLINPEQLGAIARKLYALKGAFPDEPEAAAIADYLTAEVVRVFGKQVPSSISPRHSCQISTIYLIRKHLPARARFIRTRLIPLLVRTVSPHIALPLPSRYWPVSFVDWWCSGLWEPERA